MPHNKPKAAVEVSRGDVNRPGIFTKFDINRFTLYNSLYLLMNKLLKKPKRWHMWGKRIVVLLLLRKDNARLYSLPAVSRVPSLSTWLPSILPCHLLIEMIIRIHTFAQCNLAIPPSDQYFSRKLLIVVGFSFQRKGRKNSKGGHKAGGSVFRVQTLSRWHHAPPSPPPTTTTLYKIMSDSSRLEGISLFHVGVFCNWHNAQSKSTEAKRFIS